MRSFWVVFCVLVLVLAAPSGAELQNVTVGGSIEIWSRWYSTAVVADSWTRANPLFDGTWFSSYRAAGGNPRADWRWMAQPGRQAAISPFSWSKRGHNLGYVEQRSTINVKADFSELVSAFIEFDSYDVWGEDFRSDYITGADGRAASLDDVEIYQSYVDVKSMLGTPLSLRLGRQELVFGSSWLLGNNSEWPWSRLSFDALRATYATDLLSVDAWWAKLAENSPLEEDGDIDFYGLYVSYLGVDDITLDAYYLLIRDAQARQDTQGAFLSEWVEDALGVDDYDPTYLHTVGVRGAGQYGALDFEAEVAYQFGNADAVGAQFAGAGLRSPYGPGDARYDNWGANLEVGYTFDKPLSPRVYIGGAYLGGEDNRDIDAWNWIGAVLCPFWHADASVSFNRLFSDWAYSEFIENTDLSNAWVARAGASICPTDKTELRLAITYLETIEPYHSPWPVSFWLGRRFTWFAPLSFADRSNDKDLGWEVALYATYDYSESLSLCAGYAHLFVGDGLSQGNFSGFNGLGYNGGTGADDPDYVFVKAQLTF